MLLVSKSSGIKAILTGSHMYIFRKEGDKEEGNGEEGQKRKEYCEGERS